MIGTVGQYCTNPAAFENAKNRQRYHALGGRHHVVNGALVDLNLQRPADAWPVFVQIIDREQSTDGAEIFGDCFGQWTPIETVQAIPCQ